MAKLGCFGDLVFSVSDNTVRTFNDMSWKVSANYATHDRHMQRDLLEFLGPSLNDISFSMTFSVFHGTNPLAEVKKLQEMCETGEKHQLILGKKKYGEHKWVITDVSTTLERFDNKGNLWIAVCKVSLREYAKR